MTQPLTVTEKILASHVGREGVTPGEIANARMDLIVAHEVTTPPAVRMLTVICGDPHTTALGAFGAFATGVGSTDLAAALATGELWFKVPETMRFNVSGELLPGVYTDPRDFL